MAIINKTRVTTGLLSAVFALTMVLGGCTAQKKPLPTPTPNPRPNAPAPTPSRVAPAPSPAPAVPTPGMQPKARAAADDIADNVARVNGVNKAYVVVVGNVALIGIDLDKDIQHAQTEKVREQVASRAKGDPRIVNSVVETDADSVARIQKMAQGIQRGQPISTFFSQITEFFNRAKPSTD